MSRIARVVVPGMWHHVTQRGNRRQSVFFDEGDRSMYLRMIAEQCERYEVAIGGYCLMPNHVHLIARPETEDGLARALGRAHNDYARWFHVTRRLTGHLWQNRFFSTVLDWQHLWNALCYVERNPVRAGLAADPVEWGWSSARAHVTGVDDRRLLDMAAWMDDWGPGAWELVLRDGVDNALVVKQIRDATRTGRPFGPDEFVASVEARLGRRLRPAKRGPKPKADAGNFEVM